MRQALVIKVGNWLQRALKFLIMSNSSWSASQIWLRPQDAVLASAQFMLAWLWLWLYNKPLSLSLSSWVYRHVSILLVVLAGKPLASLGWPTYSTSVSYCTAHIYGLQSVDHRRFKRWNKAVQGWEDCPESLFHPYMWGSELGEFLCTLTDWLTDKQGCVQETPLG